MAKPTKTRKPEGRESVAISDARTRLTELVNRAAYGNERTLIVKRGKTIAAIVSAADLAALDGAA